MPKLKCFSKRNTTAKFLEQLYTIKGIKIDSGYILVSWGVRDVAVTEIPFLNLVVQASCLHGQAGCLSYH